MAAWSRKTSKKIHRFLENEPITRKFSKVCSESIHCDTHRRVVFKFCEIWLTEIGKIAHTERARKWIQYSAEFKPGFQPNKRPKRGTAVFSLSGDNWTNSQNLVQNARWSIIADDEVRVVKTSQRSTAWHAATNISSRTPDQLQPYQQQGCKSVMTIITNIVTVRSL